MIKAIIFDFFGVLAVKDVGSFRKTFFPENVAKMEKANELQEQLGLGLLRYDDFIDGLAKLGGVDRDTVLGYTESGYAANTKLVNYITTLLKPKYRLGIISNAGADWVARILEEDIKLFDDIVLSYKVGVIKPDPAIYKLSAKNLNIDPAECVFVDDIATYCQGAEAVGMRSVWYRDFAQMKTDLEQILSTNSNN